MIKLQYFTGSKFIDCGDWHHENLAWVSLGGDDANYRTVDSETGKVLTDKTTKVKNNEKNYLCP